MAQNRPGSRQRNITGTGKAEKRGNGLGTGPVGARAGTELLKKLAERVISKGKK